MTARSFGSPVLMGMALALAAAFAATAQPAPQPSGAMQGFQMNRDQPVKIESNTLEVRDKSRQATFMGDVKLTQGDMTLQCKTLVVFYEDAPAPTASKKGAPPAQKSAGLGGNQQIKRVEAKGDVFVTQKDQTAKGDNGIYELKSNSITLIGNVVVTQGVNVLRGERMVVDMGTGVTRVESSKTGGRVEMLAQPSAAPGKAAPAPPAAAPAPAPPAAKSGPGAPTRIN